MSHETFTRSGAWPNATVRCTRCARAGGCISVPRIEALGTARQGDRGNVAEKIDSGRSQAARCPALNSRAGEAPGEFRSLGLTHYMHPISVASEDLCLTLCIEMARRRFHSLESQWRTEAGPSANSDGGSSVRRPRCKKGIGGQVGHVSILHFSAKIRRGGIVLF